MLLFLYSDECKQFSQYCILTVLIPCYHAVMIGEDMCIFDVYNYAPIN